MFPKDEVVYSPDGVRYSFSQAFQEQVESAPLENGEALLLYFDFIIFNEQTVPLELEHRRMS